jgi:hypothetical protein
MATAKRKAPAKKAEAITDEQAAALLAELDGEENTEATDEDLAAAVAAQEAQEAVADSDEDEGGAAPSTDAKSASENKKTAAKKRSPQPKLSNSKPSAVINAVAEKDLHEYLGVSIKDLKDKLVEIDKAPQKVGEKVVNTVKAMKNGTHLSNYTAYALGLLVDKGEFTSAELREVYTKHPYSVGTANAQSSQMFKLLPLLGVADRTANDKLVLIKDSPVYLALQGMAKASK